MRPCLVCQCPPGPSLSSVACLCHLSLNRFLSDAPIPTPFVVLRGPIRAFGKGPTARHGGVGPHHPCLFNSPTLSPLSPHVFPRFGADSEPGGRACALPNAECEHPHMTFAFSPFSSAPVQVWTRQTTEPGSGILVSTQNKAGPPARVRTTRQNRLPASPSAYSDTHPNRPTTPLYLLPSLSLTSPLAPQPLSPLSFISQPRTSSPPPPTHTHTPPPFLPLHHLLPHPVSHTPSSTSSRPQPCITPTVSPPSFLLSPPTPPPSKMSMIESSHVMESINILHSYHLDIRIGL